MNLHNTGSQANKVNALRNTRLRHSSNTIRYKVDVFRFFSHYKMHAKNSEMKILCVCVCFMCVLYMYSSYEKYGMH